jgi:hypothetical protein
MLRTSLEKTNDLAEEFERKWYLLVDEIVVLKEAVEYRDIAIKELKQQVLEQQARILMQHKALGKLACLGNGENWGNSEGNTIAQTAMYPCDIAILEYHDREVSVKAQEEVAKFIESTDLKALPEEWKIPAASMIIAYADAIRRLK